MRRTWMLVLLGLGFGFGSGYWLDEWINAREAKARFIRSVSWAIEQRLLSVNADRLREMQSE